MKLVNIWPDLTAMKLYLTAFSPQLIQAEKSRTNMQFMNSYLRKIYLQQTSSDTELMVTSGYSGHY